jgi:Rrf2 family transcriptional regulator, nitric oxide-sensitive transcriptional repressor
MYLALHEDRLTTIAEMATRCGISRNHLMKVASDLSAAGYIETARGKRGGLSWQNRADRLLWATPCAGPKLIWRSYCA